MKLHAFLLCLVAHAGIMHGANEGSRCPALTKLTLCDLALIYCMEKRGFDERMIELGEQVKSRSVNDHHIILIGPYTISNSEQLPIPYELFRRMCRYGQHCNSSGKKEILEDVATPDRKFKMLASLTLVTQNISLELEVSGKNKEVVKNGIDNRIRFLKSTRKELEKYY